MVLSQTRKRGAAILAGIYSHCQDVKLFGMCWGWIVEILGLSFAHHMDHFGTADCDYDHDLRFETEHGSDAAHDAPMVLLDPAVETAALTDEDLWRRSARLIRQHVLTIAGHNRVPVRLATVDDNALRPAMGAAIFGEGPWKRRTHTTKAA